MKVSRLFPCKAGFVSLGSYTGNLKTNMAILILLVVGSTITGGTFLS